MAKFTQTLIAISLFAFGVLFDAASGRSETNLKPLKAGVWVGAVRGNSQGAATSCNLYARKTNKEFWIALKLDNAGLHIILYNKNWTLNSGEKYRSRVVIDDLFDDMVNAKNINASAIDFLFGSDEPSMESIQSGRRISLTTQNGVKTFKLQGTRKAVDTLITCADTYLTAERDNPPTTDPFQAGVKAYKSKNYREALRRWMPLAENGSAKVQNLVGILYYNGQGVKKDFVRAARWFRRAADQDYGRAQNNLGEMYRDGKGVPPDDARAVALFRSAAINGVDKATKNIVAMLTAGRTGHATSPGRTKPDRGNTPLAGEWKTGWGQTTIAWTGSRYRGRYLAENGDAHNNGTFSLQRHGKSLTGIWAESLANQKCPTKRMGTYYWGRLRLDGPVLKSGFSIAWGYCGNGALENSWNFVARTADATPKAASGTMTKTPAEPGADALIDRAFSVLEGTPTPEQAAQARKDVAAAVAKGDRRAMLLLSLLLEKGIGGPADADKARDYLDQAADALLPDALYRRALLTAQTSPDSALRDIRLAAAEGFVPALQVYATLEYWERSNPGNSDGAVAPKIAKGDLIAIQAMLNSLGYQAGPPLGAMTGKTMAAITAFQKKENLPVDGLASNRLRDQLVKVLGRGN